MGELLPYSRDEAEGQQQLWLVCQAGGKRLKPIASGRYCAGRRCGPASAPSSKRVIVTTAHVLQLQLPSGRAGGGAHAEPQLEWHERLLNVATAEETAAEVLLHLKDGGVHAVKCSTSAERRAVLQMVERGLRVGQQQDVLEDAAE